MCLPKFSVSSHECCVCPYDIVAIFDWYSTHSVFEIKYIINGINHNISKTLLFILRENLRMSEEFLM